MGITYCDVRSQTVEICMTAMQQFGNALHHVRSHTPEICMAAVQQDGNAMIHVRRFIKN